ncbi:MAG: glycosyltransferase family 1 protein [bacterium]|nr:glycosyltransferase family 1 protein [bacterium]
MISESFFEITGVGSYYRTVLSWCRKNDGMRVIVVCPENQGLPAGEFGEDVIPVRAMAHFRNPFYPDLILGWYSKAKLRKIISSISGPKVVHIANSGSLPVAGAVAARQLEVPMVGWFHTDVQKYCRLYGRSILGPPGAWLGGKVGLTCNRWAYKHCLAICGPSATAAESVRRFFPGEVEVIPNPVDMERFHPAQSRNGRFRERYRQNGRVLAAVVGRVAKEKNLDLLCQLLGSDDRIDLVLVGDGPYAEALKRRWNATVTGFLHGDDLLAAYQQADLFVQLSVTETFGLSLVEAMAAGLPVVALRSPGFVGRIPPGNGVDVIEEHELSTLADRCVALVEDQQRHQQSSRNVRDFVQQISADEIISKFMEFHRPYAR